MLCCSSEATPFVLNFTVPVTLVPSVARVLVDGCEFQAPRPGFSVLLSPVCTVTLPDCLVFGIDILDSPQADLAYLEWDEVTGVLRKTPSRYVLDFVTSILSVRARPEWNSIQSNTTHVCINEECMRMSDSPRDVVASRCLVYADMGQVRGLNLRASDGCMRNPDVSTRQVSAPWSVLDSSLVLSLRIEDLLACRTTVQSEKAFSGTISVLEHGRDTFSFTTPYLIDISP